PIGETVRIIIIMVMLGLLSWTGLARMIRAQVLAEREKEFVLAPTGEDGVKQIRALLGLEDLITNVNIPNLGQIPNMPIGAVVETNAYFTTDSVQPVSAGNVPASVMPLVGRIAFEQECVVNAGITKDLNLAFGAFAADPLVRLSLNDSKALFNQMIKNTSAYLGMYKMI
ncbi:MAG: hypothetical protein IJN36_04375, partial [Clostridia bacterium]|nr:hypothetical protein [Clostridia bacterium]